jgi:hypothetical protein
MAGGYYFTVTLIDEKKRTTTRRFQLVEAATPADAVTDIGTFVTALKAVTQCGVIKATLLVPVDPTPTAGGAGSNIDAGATVSGWVTEYLKKASLKWPDPDATAKDVDGSIDLTDAGVIAFLGLFESDDGICELSDGEQIAAGKWIKGKLDR